MNQLFNLERFLRYAKYDWIKNRTTYLSWVGGVFLFFVLIFFPIFTLSGNDAGNILYMITPIFIIMSLTLVGLSFNEYRNKDSTISNLMIPVSSFEKIFHFFICKFLPFIISFPIFYYLATSTYFLIGRNINEIFSFTIPELNNYYFETPTLRNFIDNDLFQKEYGNFFNLLTVYRFISFLFIVVSLIPFRIQSKRFWFVRWLLCLLVVFFTLTTIRKFETPYSASIWALSSNLFIVLVWIKIILIWVYSYYILKEKQV
jgi:hypothetical protein